MKFPCFTFLSFVVLLFACNNQHVRPHTSKKIRIASSKTIKVKTHTDSVSVCIAAVGDIMLGSSYPSDSYLFSDKARNSFTQVLPDIADADIKFGNLEGTLLDNGAPDTTKKSGKTGYFFRMPKNYGMVLKNAGFNVLSIANNHITDFGSAGYNSTISTLNHYGIHYAGLQKCPSTIFMVKGLKIGFCAFAPNSGTVSMLNLDNAVKLIKQLKQQCDVVMVSFHGGAEGTTAQHVTFKNEFFKGENRGNAYVFTHAAIDAGADIVLGNGPHVSRAMEKYKGRLIAYSLGNFCTYKSISVMGVSGMAPLLKVYLNKKGEFLRGRLIAFKQSHEKGLERDDQKLVIDRIRTLTETDFPHAGLTIDADGKLTPKNG